MRCPFCDFENLAGTDHCARCQADLSDLNSRVRSAEIEGDLLDRPLGELARHDYVTVSPQTKVSEVVARLNEQGSQCAIVVNGDEVVGIFTERDILNHVIDRFDTVSGQPVDDFMTPKPEVLQEDDTVAAGLNRMTIGGFRHLPIQREGKLVGMVSVRDILGYMVGRFTEVFS